VAIEQLQEAMPPAHDVTPHILATPHEVAGGFLRLVGHADGRQFPRAEQPDQFARIAAIGFDALAGAARRQRRCDHVTRHVARRDLAVEVVPGDARLVARLHGAFASESPSR